MSPNDKAEKIVDFLTKDSYVRALLMTSICHGLTSEEIDKLYYELYKHQENTEETN